MKNFFKLSALLLAAGYPCVAFAEVLGAHLPSYLSVENNFGLFVAVLIGLTFAADYSRRTRALARVSPAKVVRSPRSAESHRLAA